MLPGVFGQFAAASDEDKVRQQLGQQDVVLYDTDAAPATYHRMHPEPPRSSPCPAASLPSRLTRSMLPPASQARQSTSSLPAAPTCCAPHHMRHLIRPQAKAQKLLRLWKQQQLLERSALEQMQEALGAEVEATSSLRRSSRVQAASMSLSHEAGSEQVGGGAE